jgi:hypothetical protein
VLQPLFWPDSVATTLRTAEGFGEPTPSIHALMLHSPLKLTMVPSEPMVAPPLYFPPLPELRFPWHPQPWSLRQCAGVFELASSPSFDCPSPAQKVVLAHILVRGNLLSGFRSLV